MKLDNSKFRVKIVAVFDVEDTDTFTEIEDIVDHITSIGEVTENSVQLMPTKTKVKK